jgi:plastocyanin
MRAIIRSFAVMMSFAVFSATQIAYAQQTWQAKLGGQSKDMAKQAAAFLPNELWIHAGDSINWTSGSDDIHTVSFFIAGQKYVDFNTGCPGFSPSGTSFDGSHCVSAPPLVTGQSFAIKFPSPGNFKMICLVHPSMTGVIHVLARNAALPHDQAFYTDQAEDQQKKLLSDVDHGHMDMDMKSVSMRVIHGNASVVAGTGEISSTAAGLQALSVVRFMSETIEIHPGDTVEWTNLDPSLPHTVTFGTEPDEAHFFPPSGNVSVDADGARHATISFVGESVHSGFLVAAPMDQSGVTVATPGTTVLRITFTHPGTYDYICALHDNLGMMGKVIVK